jgi:uncharacterized protein
MLYFDTSFLAPLILAEASSRRIQLFFGRRRENELAISHWTRVEFSSVLARRVRMGTLSQKTALQADEQFESLVTDSFEVFSVAANDFNLARLYLQRYGAGLRAGDALHLAIARNHEATAIYTLDFRLRRAGRSLRLPVRTGIKTSS